MPIRVLFLEFEPDAGPGRLGTGLEALGAQTEVASLHRSQALPNLDRYQGIVPLGGSMNATDDQGHPYLSAVVIALQQAARREVPVLGICLGGQLLARALGARVWHKQRPEIGYFPIRLTEAGQNDPLFAGFDPELITLQWHEDAFDLPSGAALLADSPRDSAQAFCSGSCYGLQFHPEATTETVRQWSVSSDQALAAAATPTTREELLRQAGEVEARFALQTTRLCENWLALVERACGGRRVRSS